MLLEWLRIVLTERCSSRAISALSRPERDQAQDVALAVGELREQLGRGRCLHPPEVGGDPFGDRRAEDDLTRRPPPRSTG